jgi:hypothetical protein
MRGSGPSPRHVISSSPPRCARAKKARLAAGSTGVEDYTKIELGKSKVVSELHRAPQRITSGGAVANLGGLIIN